MKIPSYTIEPPADDLVAALAMLSEKNGVSQKEFIFKLEDKGIPFLRESIFIYL